MRLATLLLATVCATGAVGCGHKSTGTGGNASTSTGAGSTTAGSTSSATASTTTAGSTSTGMGAPCALPASCPSPGTARACVGLVDNTGKSSFGLRMAEIDFTDPPAITTGIVKTTFANAVQLNEPACNLPYGGTGSWLLAFDTQAGTLKVGGGKPVADPTQGYAFDTDTVMGFSLAPVTFSAKPDVNGSFATPTGQDLVMPVFLDSSAANVVLLPIKQARVKMATLSTDDNCIGTYNAAGLSPMNNCAPDSMNPLYVDGGSLDGFIVLEDADKVLISPLNQTLCVLLSGNASMYGTTQPGSADLTCKRDGSGTILFQGDWCSTTNMPTAGGCSDAVHLSANFAASSVKIQ